MSRTRPRHLPLNLDRAAQGIDHASEFDEKHVACRFDQAAAMLVDVWVDYLGTDWPEPAERALLVASDQARIARYIGGQDGGQPAIDAASAQNTPP
jgi:hypothetical protein